MTVVVMMYPVLSATAELSRYPGVLLTSVRRLVAELEGRLFLERSTEEVERLVGIRNGNETTTGIKPFLMLSQEEFVTLNGLRSTGSFVRNSD
jgi:hypothetical protein